VAEEIVADISVELWQERHTLRVEHAMAAYLYATARNRARNAVRHERVERRWRETAAPSVTTHSHVTTETERALDAPRIRAIVQRAVESLPPQRRMVLHLRWGRGMSYAEIARIMGSSVVAVERQLGRTLKALRLALPAWLGTEDIR
jgi:RNA polymerase sigma-70 factor (ECF subfamily)